MFYDYEKIVSEFQLNGEFLSAVPFGEGHVNETFLVEVLSEGKVVRYILQKINGSLFKEADKLMNNIRLVTEFINKKIVDNGGNPEKECLFFLKTNTDKLVAYTEWGNFRMFNYIDGVAYQVVDNPEVFYQSAVAFGNFANLLSDFDATLLYDILPDFHNTVKRLDDFKKSVNKNKKKRAESVQKEINFVLQRSNYANRIIKLLKEGTMPLRVTHNDTKLNNVIFDRETNKFLAVIDLDTIMAGSICYDFGDSIRFGCNTSTEDQPDLSKVNFDISLFEEYTKGYLSKVGKSLTKIEKDNLAFSAILLTYECGMRFLADHLDGDTYFKITRPNQNLDRARTQFKLISDMEKAYPEMCRIVNKY